MRLFFSYFKPHWKLFTADLCCAAFIAAVDIIFPMASRYSIQHFLPKADYAAFYTFIVIMIGLYLIRSAAQYFVTYFGHLFGVKVEADMRRDLFRHIEKQSFHFFDTNRTGQLMSRITTDLFEITELSHHGPEDIFISILTLTGSLALMASIRWELALLLTLFIPIAFFHTVRCRVHIMKASRRVKEETAAINTAIESALSGIRVTQIFTNEHYEQDRFEKNNQAFYTAKKRFYWNMAFFFSRLEFFISMLHLVIIAAGGFFIMQQTMTLTDLITATLFAGAFLQPIRRLTAFIELYANGMAGFKRFKELIETDDSISDHDNAVEITSAHGNIRYHNVSFSYQDGVTVLQNIELDIQAGQTIAFVGPSGGGKTSLCNLLPRFYEPSAGTITLDGRNIQDITVHSLRRQIGIVQQEVFLFAGTIKENIAYGNSTASEQDIIQAAKRAEIHEDIMQMPDGYNTLVGERGVRLSGGQKQRVAIARTFLKNPPILILDEATSALDTATETKIQKSFEELARGRTTLVIAHRLSTIRSADRIVVVDDEGICEQGTHTELLAKGGVYAALYNAQNNMS